MREDRRPDTRVSLALLLCIVSSRSIVGSSSRSTCAAHSEADTPLAWALGTRELLGEGLLLGVQLVIQELLRKLLLAANLNLRRTEWLSAS